MIFSKVSKTIQWEKHCFQTFVYGKLDTKLQKIKGDPDTIYKINWKWSKDLKVELKIKLLEENIWQNFKTLYLAMIFWLHELFLFTTLLIPNVLGFFSHTNQFFNWIVYDVIQFWH